MMALVVVAFCSESMSYVKSAEGEGECVAGMVMMFFVIILSTVQVTRFVIVIVTGVSPSRGDGDGSGIFCGNARAVVVARR